MIVEKPAIIRLLTAEPATCEAHMGPSMAKTRVESQLAARAIVGCVHIVVSDQAQTTTQTAPIAASANP